MDRLVAKEIKQGDFFTLSKTKGYSESQRKEAMQVMELYDDYMTVSCKGGCTIKPYDHFEKVDDLAGFKLISESRYFEDNRSK